MAADHDRPRLTAAALVASNLVPLVGVVAYGWSVATLLVLYWLESAVVGAAFVARIGRAAGRDDPDDLPDLSFNGRPVSSFANADRRTVAGFFVVHYGGFWVVHGVFVAVALSVFGSPLPDPFATAVGLLGIGASHAYSYRANYLGEGEYERVGPATLMVEPYRRVLVLHVTVGTGLFVAGLLRGPVGLLAVMVLVKTALDLRGHWREHERARTRSPGDDPWDDGRTPDENPDAERSTRQ